MNQQRAGYRAIEGGWVGCYGLGLLIGVGESTKPVSVSTRVWEACL